MISNRLLICTKTSDNNPIIGSLYSVFVQIVSIGTHQGGKSAAEEFYLYNNEIVRDLELACNKSEMMAGHPTSVLAVADDCAATVTDSDPREVLHKM